MQPKKQDDDDDQEYCPDLMSSEVDSDVSSSEDSGLEMEEDHEESYHSDNSLGEITINTLKKKHLGASSEDESYQQPYPSWCQKELLEESLEDYIKLEDDDPFYHGIRSVSDHEHARPQNHHPDEEQSSWDSDLKDGGVTHRKSHTVNRPGEPSTIQREPQAPVDKKLAKAVSEAMKNPSFVEHIKSILKKVSSDEDTDDMSIPDKARSGPSRDLGNGKNPLKETRRSRDKQGDVAANETCQTKKKALFHKPNSSSTKARRRDNKRKKSKKASKQRKRGTSNASCSSSQSSSKSSSDDSSNETPSGKEANEYDSETMAAVEKPDFYPINVEDVCKSFEISKGRYKAALRTLRELIHARMDKLKNHPMESKRETWTSLSFTRMKGIRLDDLKKQWYRRHPVFRKGENDWAFLLMGQHITQDRLSHERGKEIYKSAYNEAIDNCLIKHAAKYREMMLQFSEKAGVPVRPIKREEVPLRDIAALIQLPYLGSRSGVNSQKAELPGNAVARKLLKRFQQKIINKEFRNTQRESFNVPLPPGLIPDGRLPARNSDHPAKRRSRRDALKETETAKERDADEAAAGHGNSKEAAEKGNHTAYVALRSQTSRADQADQANEACVTNSRKKDKVGSNGLGTTGSFVVDERISPSIRLVATQENVNDDEVRAAPRNLRHPIVQTHEYANKGVAATKTTETHATRSITTGAVHKQTVSKSNAQAEQPKVGDDDTRTVVQGTRSIQKRHVMLSAIRGEKNADTSAMKDPGTVESYTLKDAQGGKVLGNRSDLARRKGPAVGSKRQKLSGTHDDDDSASVLTDHRHERNAHERPNAVTELLCKFFDPKTEKEIGTCVWLRGQTSYQTGVVPAGCSVIKVKLVTGKYFKRTMPPTVIKCYSDVGEMATEACKFKLGNLVGWELLWPTDCLKA